MQCNVTNVIYELILIATVPTSTYKNVPMRGIIRSVMEVLSGLQHNLMKRFIQKTKDAK